MMVNVKTKKSKATQAAKRRTVALRKKTSKVPPPLKFKQELKDYFKSVKKRLPTSLSGWILQSVDDAIRLSRMKNKYQLNMGVYNQFRTTGGYSTEVCQICLGGAAIVGRSLVEPGDDTNGSATKNIASALNSVRLGYLESAISLLYEGDELQPIVADKLRVLSGKLRESYYESFNSTDLAKLERPSWKVLRSVARDLAKIGL